jgi:histone acetyltransferase (RNA polymerase elongator complex component)
MRLETRNSINEGILNTRHYTIPIFIPQLACPFQCVFCNQEKITSRGHIPVMQETRNTIEDFLASFPKGNKHIEIGFFGGNFTGIPLEDQEKYLGVARPFLEKGIVQGIRLSTRPDYIDEKRLHLLKNYGVTTIELGAQSLDDEVLIQSARGHTAEDVEKASGMIISAGFRLGLQMMVGLPGDTLEKSVFTARKIIELGACETRIYPVLVIKGTKMAEWYEEDKYKPLSMEDTILWLKTLLPLFEDAGVEVTRVGLHSSEGLLSGKELVAGPFHTSTRELAMTEVWWDRLKYLLKEASKDKISISVHPSQYNFAIGYYGKNRKRLLQHFRDVIFLKNPSLKENEYNVEC